MKRFLHFCFTTFCMLLLVSLYFVSAGAASKTVTPNPPTSFYSSALGDKSVTLRWNPGANAQGYGIYQYDSTTKSYQLIGTVKATTYANCVYVVKKLTAGKTYRFYIKSYRVSNGKKVWSKASSVVKITAKEFSDEVKSVHTAYYTVTTKKAVSVTITSGAKKGKKKKLAKGTKLTVTSKTGTTVKGYLKSGTAITVKRSALSYTGLDIQAKTSADYTTQTKEDYVNYKNYTSPTKYLIWISQYKCKVNVFQGSRGKWKLIKTYPCSIGTWVDRTPGGIRRILAKYTSSKYGGPYPIIYFSPGENGSSANPQGAAFHYYNAPGMMNRPGVLGKSVSNGCCRLQADALWWIYQNCPVGTTVISL